MADPAESATPEQPAPKRAGPQPNWMTAGGPAPVGRGKALFVGLMLIVAIAGVLVGILMLPAAPVNAYLVSIPFPLYEDTALPPVAYAETDSKLLVDCLPKNAENAYTAGELQPLRNKLNAIAAGKIRLEPGESNAKTLEPGQPFILHVVGHAAVKDDAVYLMPLKAELDNPDTWLPLADLLKTLTECPTPKKLLVLDLGHPRTNAFLGPLTDDVTPKLHDWLAKQRAELPCPVFVSCSSGEESLVIPQVQASAFAFYLAEGLRGAADGYSAAPPDGKVKVRELAEFVRVRVARWARQNRDLPQVAKLFEPTDFQDFDLMLDVPPPVVEDPDPRKLPYAKAGVVEGWTAYGAMPTDSIRLAGPQLARWTSAAIRAEQVFAANPDDSRAADAARTAADWWREVGAGSQPAATLPHRSLANVTIPPAAATPGPAAALKAALERHFRSALPEPGTKVDDQDAAERKAAFELAAGALAPSIAGKIIWDWLFERFPDNSQPKSREIAFVWDAMNFAMKNDPELYVECIALRRMTALEVPPFERPEARATLLKFLRLEAFSASALRSGSAGFEWIAPFMAAADEAKLQAEQALFRATSRAEVEQADRAIDTAMSKFADVADRYATLAMARETVADALRVLAGTALSQAEFDWPISSERNAVTFKDWNDLAVKTRALADELYRKPPSNWETSKWKRSLRDIADQTRAISKETDAAVAKRLVDAAPSARPADLRRYRAALLTTTLAGAERGQVWDAAEAIAERLHLATRKDADLLDNESRSVTKPPALPAPQPDGRARRAAIGVRMLELAGHPAAGKLGTQLDELRRAETPEKWSQFAGGLRQAWVRTAITKLLAGDPASDIERIERLARAIPPGLWQDTPEKASVGDWRVATAQRRGRDESVWRAWLAAHYRKYATVRTDVPKATERYQKAAEEADRKPRD